MNQLYNIAITLVAIPGCSVPEQSLVFNGVDHETMVSFVSAATKEGYRVSITRSMFSKKAVRDALLDQALGIE